MPQAFILRLNPSENNHLSNALEKDEIMIGWSKAEGLLDLKLPWEEFRDKVKAGCYEEGDTSRSVGRGAGQIWCFLREMRPEDYVLVPSTGSFYVARVASEGPTYNAEYLDRDSAYRRKVVWLNEKKPIPRTYARAALVARMRSYGACTRASDLVSEIEEALSRTANGEAPEFFRELRSKWVKQTAEELLAGYMDSDRFEFFIRDLMMACGAKDARVVPRILDKGVDVLATFLVAGTFELRIAVQAKFWKKQLGALGSNVVEQLIEGIEAEEADLGIVITTGEVAPGAKEKARKHHEQGGVRIEFMDLQSLAAMVVEYKK
jgi:predicted Mrr-cat superfamily restriction endonuclease